MAHYRATGKRSLLDVAIKAADLICTVFGPDARHDAPGHEEIELALVKLYRVTGERKYLDEAKFFLDQRGRPHTVPPVQFPRGNRFFMYNDLSYRQDQTPVVDETRAVGHAVREMYLLSGMTDVAALLGDTAFGQAVDRLWQDVTSKRIYVTGGLGSNYRTEAFGDDYQLPNRAYAETCASVGGLLWYHRMFLREGDASYLDVFERTLYNGYLSGVSLAGDTFFYQNPLESDGTRARQAYFDVACCPANLARLMAQLPGLVYAQRDREVYVTLFVGSDATLEVGGVKTAIAQQTDYPWTGDVAIRVDPAAPVEFTLAMRIPGWARGEAMPTDLYRFSDVVPGSSPAPQAGLKASATHGSSVVPGFSPAKQEPTLTVNGRPVDLASLTSGFARITRRWQKGDRVELTLPMPVRQVVANDAGGRGPGQGRHRARSRRLRGRGGRQWREGHQPPPAARRAAHGDARARPARRRGGGDGEGRSDRRGRQGLERARSSPCRTSPGRIGERADGGLDPVLSNARGMPAECPGNAHGRMTRQPWNTHDLATRV